MNIYFNEQTKRWELIIDEPSKVLDLGIYREMMEQKADEFPFCLAHKERVIFLNSNYPNPDDISVSNKNHSVVTPLNSVILSGCCPEIIKSQLESFDRVLDEYRKNNPIKVIGL